jgi:hypothetical protein
MWHNKDCQMAWAWRQTIAMDWLHAGWQKSYSHSQEKHWRGLWPPALHRGAFYCPTAMKPGLDELIEGLGNGCYTLRYALSSSAENSQILSHSFFRRLWVWNNSSVVKLRYQSVHKKFSTWINFLWNQSIGRNLIAGHWTFFKVWAAKCMNIRTEEKD